MPEFINLHDNISIVLKRPRVPENIGAAARAICNMGLKSLIVVEPANFDISKINKMATHVAEDIVSEIQISNNIKTALEPFSYIVGSTARLGKYRKEVVTPKQAAETIINTSKKNKVAVLFGPEDRGLLNEDIHMCNILVNIPTADFSSINLAQAVMIISHEIFTEFQKKNNTESETFMPRLATRHEIEVMLEHLETTLLKIDFMNPQNPLYWMNKFRKFFAMLPLRARDIRMLRGLCKQIIWYGEKRYKDGITNKDFL